LTRPEPHLLDLADGSLLVEYPDLSDEEANGQAVAAACALERQSPKGFLYAVPGARTLLVEFDPARIGSARFATLFSETGAAPPAETRRTLRIPVAYGGEAGADLSAVARGAGMTAEEFARRHAQASYRVAFLGFAPGFAYLTGLPPELHVARLPTPRTRVPAGAVAVAGPYSGIYPGETPGGWRLIGRTTVRLFDPQADPPALFAPGDRVLFEPVQDLPSSFSPVLGGHIDHAIPGPPLFRVLSAGLFSSIQGAPRYGWSRYGVPPGGAMDPRALARGNARLGNAASAAALEMTLLGAELEALRDVQACLEGAMPEARHDGRAIRCGEAIRLRAGERLRVERILEGARSYLCVEGGLAQVERAQISPRLIRGDLLCSRQAPPAPDAAVRGPAEHAWAGRAADLLPSRTTETLVRVVLGPHPERFTQEGLATFVSSIYRVSASSDRRGIRLEGSPVGLAEAPDLPPEGTPLGGIQVASDGMPIVLGPDRPVTGGYVRIATVIQADFPLLAQAQPGSPVRFVAVGLAEALAARVG
jgi:KipI family sensor histidine kinase inhibitor